MPAIPPENVIKPPLAEVRPHALTAHGITWIDPYYWLRERDDPAVMDYLRAENAYTAAMMESSKALREDLYRELLGRIEEDYQSAEHIDGRHSYYFRYEPGHDYPVYCRKAVPDGPEEVYLDANKLAADREFFELGFLEISPDATTLAAAIDTSGDEKFVLRFKDLRTGNWLPDEVAVIDACGGEWSADGQYFFYVVHEEENQRPHRVLRHRMGTPVSADVLVYEEKDPLFYVGLEKSQDRRYLFATSESKMTGEVSFLDSHEPEGAFEVLLPRRRGVRYHAEHHEGRFLLQTNLEAKHFRLVAVPVTERTWSGLTEIVPHDEQVDLMDFLPLAGHLVLFTRIRGVDQVRVRSWEGNDGYTVEFPEAVYVLGEAVNAEYETNCLNLVYESPITPPTTFQINLETRERTVLKQARVPSGHRHDDYVAYRVEVRAADGTDIPLTIYYRKDLPRDGSAACYLYGYGSYGETSEPTFSRGCLGYLRRGFVCAVAHVRGGGLLGEPWYEAGKLLNKKNSFSDFIACAEYLVTNAYTRPDRLAIQGGSAGGLLIGAVLNERPDLFAVAVADVPFVDVVTTMLDETIPLTTYEWEEWGDPRKKLDFDYMRGYSPYDNVRARHYPALLVTAGLNDSRVQYWEAAKWIAKLRATATGGGPFLLKCNLEAGHGGVSARYEAFRELALEQAFVIRRLAHKCRS